jgi:LysM repeat protein
VIERPQPEKAVYTGAAVSEMREGRFFWLIALLLVGSTTQCQTHIPNDPTLQPEVSVETTTPPPSPTATVETPQSTPVLTATTTITTTAAVETATAEPSPTPIIYVIEEGDTLLALAIDRGTTVEEILALNPRIQPALLQIGQQVILPPETAAPAAAGVPDDLPAGVSVAGVWSYPNPAGGWWILGEVVNDSEQPVENVQVTVDLLDSAGNVLQSHSAWTANSVIRSGGRSPFGVLVVEAPADFDHVTATITAGNGVNNLGSRYLDLLVTEAEWIEEEGVRRLSGEVQNEGAAVASGVAVVATFYDAEGRVTGYIQHRLEEDLAPGASLPFTLEIVPPGGVAESYDLTAEGVTG